MDSSDLLESTNRSYNRLFVPTLDQWVIWLLGYLVIELLGSLGSLG